MSLAPPLAPERVGRDGRLALAFERRGGRTVLARSRFTLPLQVLAPVELDDPACVVSLLNPTGGLVGGDRLAIDVALGPGAHACLTTPSASKVYRAAGPPALQDVDVRLAEDSVLEWVPDHTIPFPGAAFRQRITVAMAPGARLILADAFAAGRVARGEAWTFASLASGVEIRDETGWLFLDRFELTGGPGWPALGLSEDQPYFATVAVIGDETPAALARALADAFAGVPGARAGVAALARRGVVARCLAPSAPSLGSALGGIWSAARARLLGLGPLELRRS